MTTRTRTSGEPLAAVTLTGTHTIRRDPATPPSARHSVTVGPVTASGATLGEARVKAAQRVTAHLDGMGEPIAIVEDGEGAQWLFVPLGDGTAVYRYSGAPNTKCGSCGAEPVHHPWQAGDDGCAAWRPSPPPSNRTLRPIAGTDGTPREVAARYLAEGAIPAPARLVVAS